MGICFEVGSIVRTPPNPPLPPGSPFITHWHEERWQLVRKICDHFGWAEPPWLEPSDLGTASADVYCCNYSRYVLLQEAASWLMRERNDVEARSQQSGDRESVRRLPFRHLCERRDSGEMAIYLPLDVVAPIVLSSDALGITFTVGSSERLAGELRELRPLLAEAGGKEATRVWLSSSRVAHTWGALEELCEVLTAFAEQSQRLALPLHLLW